MSNLGTPFKILAFGHSNGHADGGAICIAYPMSVAGNGELRFRSQWAFKHAPLSRVLFALAWLSCWSFSIFWATTWRRFCSVEVAARVI